VPAPRPLSPALAAANRDLAGLSLFYGDRKAWREGRDAEVIQRALRRVRIVYWAVATVYAAAVAEAALGLLGSEADPAGRRGWALVALLVLTVATVLLLRRGARMAGALQQELEELGSPVPSQKAFVAVATLAVLGLIIL
jgi:hypothetical protein